MGARENLGREEKRHLNARGVAIIWESGEGRARITTPTRKGNGGFRRHVKRPLSLCYERGRKGNGENPPVPRKTAVPERGRAELEEERGS